MQEDAEVARLDAERAADRVFILFFEKDHTEDGAVAFGQFFEDPLHQLLAFPVDDRGFDVDARVGRIGSVFGNLRMARLAAQMFEHDVLADGVDEGGEALGMVETATGADDADHAQQGFLAYVLDQLRRADFGAQLQPDDVGEVPREVGFRGGVGVAEAGEVILIENFVGQTIPRWTFKGY